MSEADDASPPFRNAYRDGFRDGFAEGDRLGTKLSKKAEADSDGDGGGKVDNDGDGSTGDGDKKDDGKDDKKKGDDKGDHKGDKTDSDEDADDEKPGGDGGKPPLWKRPVFVAVALAVVLVLIVAAIVFWRHSKHHESTDDAFIDGQTSQIAAQTAGRVSRLYVTDNQLVQAGDALVDIDSRDNDARVAQVRARLAGAEGDVDQASAQIGVRRAGAAQADATARQGESELTKAAQDVARYQRVDPDAVPRQEVDAAQAAERSARARLDAARMSARAAHAQVDAALAQARAGQAQVEAAKAELSSAELQGTYTHVVAPIAGRVSKRSVEPGNVIANGQALMALVGESLWVTANYKETQLTRMQPGQAVEIAVDAFPDVKFKGHVESIQRGTGAYFSMLPAENATGNYVKVVQRVPVKIVFDDDRVRNYPIGPGMSVKPDVSLP